MNYIDNRYYVCEQIGNGKYSSTYKCIDLYENTEYAVKIYDLTHKLSSSALVELSLAYKLKHKNIVEYKDILYNENNVFIIMELCDMSLEEYIKENPYDYDKILLELIDALNYLHDMGYSHCDLAFRNLMIKNKTLKVIDFGLSCRFNRESYVKPSISVRPYEYQNNNKIDVEKIDIWALGCIYHKLINGTNITNSVKTYKKKVRNFINRLERNNYVSKKKSEFLSKMIKINSGERANIQEIINDIYIKELMKKHNYSYNISFIEEDETESLIFIDKQKLFELCDIFHSICKLNNYSYEMVLVSMNIMHGLENIGIEEYYVYGIMALMIARSIVEYIDMDFNDCIEILKVFDDKTYSIYYLKKVFSEIMTMVNKKLDTNNCYNVSYNIFEDSFKSLYLCNIISLLDRKSDNISKGMVVYVMSSDKKDKEMLKKFINKNKIDVNKCIYLINECFSEMGKHRDYIKYLKNKYYEDIELDMHLDECTELLSDIDI